MIAGDRSYRLNMSRIAAAFRGGVSLDYLEAASVHRVRELSEHTKAIAEEIKANG